ncbi:uncharacterized protein LOC131143992 [Malania oleifera]|uniref:uncharacterized protein LOC131143992 n=1 Tax=Malania oleifera TaxID=397392 RepID=UPI0025ADFED8|nr:uncharacterized protein LOC131143992 [Malania oleifera]
MTPFLLEVSLEAPRGGHLSGTTQAWVYLLTPRDVENAGDVVTVLNMHGFEVILGMNWLASGYPNIDCYKKEVVFRPPEQQEFRFVGSRMRASPLILLAMRAKRLLFNGCQEYLTWVKETPKGEVNVEDIPIVKEFPDVFPEDFPGLPLKWEVEFAIDLSLGMTQIFKDVYRMAPAELKE